MTNKDFFSTYCTANASCTANAHHLHFSSLNQIKTFSSYRDDTSTTKTHIQVMIGHPFRLKLIYYTVEASPARCTAVSMALDTVPMSSFQDLNESLPASLASLDIISHNVTQRGRM